MPPRRTAARTESDRALLLRRIPYGESSLLVHVLTPQHGRVAVLAKGAYRPSSGYFGVLDLFDELHLSWRRTRHSELGLLVRGSVALRRRALTRDLARYRAGLGVLELARLTAREGEPEPRLHALTAGTLERLCDPHLEPELVCAAHELAFLDVQGIRPALEECASCGRSLSSERAAKGGRVPFSTGMGGRLCDACAREGSASGRRVEALPLADLRIARSLIDAPHEVLARTRLDPGVTDRIRSLARRFLAYHLEVRPRTARLPRRPGRGSARPLRS